MHWGGIVWDVTDLFTYLFTVKGWGHTSYVVSVLRQFRLILRTCLQLTLKKY